MTGTMERVGTDTAWTLCSRCRTVLYGKRLTRNLNVCPDCGEHLQCPAPERVDQLFDSGTVELLDFPVCSADVLGFTDSKPYPDRLAHARQTSGLAEGVLVAHGLIGGHPVIAVVMDFRFLGGSLGAAAGELITRAAEIALRRREPLLIVCASGGARMQEGPISLMQMAKTSQALAQLDEAGVLTLALITDPTYGGVAASFATLCDVIIAEPKARLGFAGPRVIEQTIRQTLPADFQTAELLLEHGLIDAIRPRQAMRATLANLLAVADTPKATGAEAGPANAVMRDPAQLPDIDAWHAVWQARELGRPTTLDYIGRIFDDFEELRGDRIDGDCLAIVGGTALLAGCPVMVIGHQKGRTVAELAVRNYGMATPNGHRKAARLMRLAAKLGLPLVTFVDTPGAYPGVEAEERGQAVAIAETIRLMASLPVPVVTLVIGEGGSGGALALAVADEVLIKEHAVYSVISPEGCASILWRDPAKAPVAARALKMDARSLLRLGVVDGVVRESDDGIRSDHREAARRVRAALVASLRRLLTVDPTELVKQRRERFRSFGVAPGETERQVATQEIPSQGDRRLPLGYLDDDRAEALKALLEQVRHDIAQLLAEIGPTPRNLRVRAGDIFVEIEWGDVAGPVHPAADAPPATPVLSPSPVDDAEYVKAPMVGVFYHAPGLDADPFVRVGDVVLPGQQVGIVEAMKVMVPVEADRAGKVIAVLKGNGEPVEYGEPLLALAAVDT